MLAGRSRLRTDTLGAARAVGYDAASSRLNSSTRPCAASGATTGLLPLQARGHRRRPRGPRLARRAADGRRQVALLPGAGRALQAPGRRRLAAHRAHEGPGRRPAPGRRAGRVHQQQPDAGGARGRRGGLAAGGYQLLYVAPERLVTDGFARAAARARGRRSSRSTRPTASASGATTSGRSIGSCAALRERFPGVAVHAYTATATPQVRADIVAQLGSTIPGGARRRLRPAEPHLPRAAAHRSARARCSAPSGATAARPASSTASAGRTSTSWPRRSRAAACERRRYHAGLSDDERRANQDAFANERVDSSSPRSRSAWASTARTSATSSTPACPSRSSTTSRRPAAPAATGWRPSACCCTAAADYGLWKSVLARRSGRRRPRCASSARCTRSARRPSAVTGRS